MNIVTNNGGKTREKNFSRKTQISQANNDGKKSSGKSAKTRYFINTRISSSKNGGKKTREKIFPKTHE